MTTETKRCLIETAVFAVIMCLVFALGYVIGKGYTKVKEVPVISPVEKNIIDTLTITNTEIKYRIKYLDSIKYDTIEKVYTLDDSATVKLFYELCTK